MPADWTRYPAAWLEIRARIQARAKNQCEWCGAKNGDAGFRTIAGEWISHAAITRSYSAEWQMPLYKANAVCAFHFAHRCRFGKKTIRIHLSLEERIVEVHAKIIKIVCTTAHLGTPRADGSPGDKHDKMDCRPENLAFLCQRCHLLYDIDDHIAHAKATRARKRYGSQPCLELN